MPLTPEATCVVQPTTHKTYKAYFQNRHTCEHNNRNIVLTPLPQRCCKLKIQLMFGQILNFFFLLAIHRQGVRCTTPNLPKGPLLATKWTKHVFFFFFCRGVKVQKVYLLGPQGPLLEGPTPPQLLSWLRACRRHMLAIMCVLHTAYACYKSTHTGQSQCG